MVSLVSNTRCLAFSQNRQLCIFTLIMFSRIAFTKQPWHHDALGLWENNVMKRENFSPPRLCGVLCCMFQSWQKRTDANIFLWPQSTYFLLFSSIDMLEMLLTQIKQFSDPLWCLWFLWLPDHFPFTIPHSLPYWANYPCVLSWISLRVSTLA